MSVIGRRFSVGDIVSYRADLEELERRHRPDSLSSFSCYVVEEVDLKHSSSGVAYPGRQIVRICPIDPMRLGIENNRGFTEMSSNLIMGDVLRIARAIQELHVIALRMVGVQPSATKG